MNMFATENWCIKVDEKTYGPYSNDQMTEFAKQGRLSSRSLVAPAGGKNWREARHYPMLATILASDPQDRRQFGKAAAGMRQAKQPADGEAANFVVIFDVTPGTAGRLSHIVKGLGETIRLTDNVWHLQTTLSATGIKNAIMPHLQIREIVYIADTSRGRTTWHNMTPELHSRLTKSIVTTKHH
ncbi:hypothetical protein PB2503_12664 [Parvularcula bermudensis HTCC2503]|uniref:GYF domain-containing protein n=2 Tax=Parvularcula TaxID=208215 RepID=E0TFL0_PARBH|nr:hypothetical protein PB2503_12664 [Parvularcula bermudensis HTCC2503]